MGEPRATTVTTETGQAHAQPRYLTAKRAVDARARNRRVRSRLQAAVDGQPRVYEAGPGAGLTVTDLCAWGLTPATYRGIEADASVAAFARWLVPRVLRRQGYDAAATADGWTLDGAPGRIEVGDAVTALPTDAPADLIVAQSFLDLVDVDAALDAFERTLAPSGLVYAPLTFDGVTLFRPAHPADATVIERFHAAIDAEPGRDSRAGRQLLETLRRRDGELVAAGSADWVVRPVDGSYRDDERHFLACILGFVADALGDASGSEADEWLTARRRQLAAGDLTYVAHNYDLLWRGPG
ncbi:SAM-dependent methyltransferase [Halosegnis sp.]|uniref:SAM-dependent methyltransferase n=1 Tax=Halosegnis sp. TaxID=2864959 RepID=UPI0035D3E84E